MKKYLSILLFLFLGIGAYAQSANVITEILNSPAATFGQVCYLSAVHQNLIDEGASYEDAVSALYQNNQISQIIDVEKNISIIDAAHIYSFMWNVNGGLMYRLTKGSPRYVFRQFQADGIIPSDVEPASLLSGSGALSLYTSCLRRYGDFDVAAVDMGAN